MVKLSQELLAKNQKGDIALLRSKIKRCESSVWYLGTKHKAKKMLTDSAETATVQSISKKIVGESASSVTEEDTELKQKESR